MSAIHACALLDTFSHGPDGHLPPKTRNSEENEQEFEVLISHRIHAERVRQHWFHACLIEEETRKILLLLCHASNNIAASEILMSLYSECNEPKLSRIQFKIVAR